MNKPKFIKTSTVQEIKKWKKNPTAISLFTGCGGAALGLSQAGYEIRVMVECDKWACATLRANFTKKGYDDSVNKPYRKGKKPYYLARIQKREPAILQADITKLTTKEILEAGGLEVGEAFILEGGFPCQGFSTANSKRVIDDPRNKLYKECVRVIKEALPQCFLLENVPGIVSMAQGEVIRQICEDLANCGYTISWNILNAADYGVPQNRKRVFLIGFRQDGLKITKDGNPAYHMGCMPGSITHPKWYFDRYSKKNKNVEKLLKVESVNSSESPQGTMITIPSRMEFLTP